MCTWITLLAYPRILRFWRPNWKNLVPCIFRHFPQFKSVTSFWFKFPKTHIDTTNLFNESIFSHSPSPRGSIRILNPTPLLHTAKDRRNSTGQLFDFISEIQNVQPASYTPTPNTTPRNSISHTRTKSTSPQLPVFQGNFLLFFVRLF